MAEPTFDEIFEGLDKVVGKVEGARSAAQTSLTEIIELLSGVDPGVDPTGVKLLGFRMALARMDTPEEEEAFLERVVGRKGFIRDKTHQLALTPSGQKILGIEARDKPLRIDEPGFSKHDLGELAAQFGPEVLAGAGAGLIAATGGLGAPAGAGLVGLAAAGAKGIDELIESFQGLQRQSPGELSRELTTIGATAGFGELATRPVTALGRRILAPSGPKAAERSRKLGPIIQDLKNLGGRPAAGAVSKAPLVARQQALADFIFTDNPRVAQNQAAFLKEIDRLKTSSGPSVPAEDLGLQIKSDISSSRKALSAWASAKYNAIDQFATQNGIVVPTRRFKQTAQDLLDSLGTTVKTAQGEEKKLFADPQLVKTLQSIVTELPDQIPIREMRQASNQLWEAIGDEGLVPGISGSFARKLWRASRTALLDASGPDAASTAQTRIALRQANAQYGEQIRKFDDALIRRIMKDPSQAGELSPDTIVDTVFKKGRTAQMRRLFNVLPEPTKAKVRRQAMEKVLSSLTKEGEDPLEIIFDGRAFIKNLDSFGRPTLEAMFGAQRTNEMYRFGRAVQLATMKFGQAGKISASNIALRPIRNLPKTAQLKIMSKWLDTDIGFKQFTTGFEMKNTQAAMSFLSRAAIQMMGQTLVE